MQTIAVIKKDMEFNRGLSALIEVLKNIAVSQYRILEQRMRTFDKLTKGIESFFELIDSRFVPHPFLFSENSAQAVVAVTSDSGLLGGLNMQVVATAIMELNKLPGKLIIVGERGKMYARDSQVSFVGFPGILDDQRQAQAAQLRDYLVEKVLDGTFGGVKVVYPRPVTFTVQRVETVVFLPYTPPNSAAVKPLVNIHDLIVESSFKDIIEYLVSLWMAEKLSEIFGLSRQAEFAARYVHLEESLQKLKDMDNKLKLQYFRVRHELIDRNMRELFSARLLYSSQ